ncbi:hypothetical protein TSUD_200200 [Trifolium subterraneum]|nr:hypothetical protein TSUD_200200 [Trifolium subterraneum]
MVLQFTFMEDMGKLCDMNWFPQCKIIITAALVNLINPLWYARNQARFHNNHIDCKSVITMIVANTSLSGNNYKKPPLINWLKCNIDGAAEGNPGLASCGGIFRNHVANMIYCFAEPLGTASTFQAELCGAMRAIEMAHNRNWKNIWWNNMKLLLRQMNCIVSHIFREGNQVADTLANFGSSLSSLASWHFGPDFVKYSLVKNKLGIPSFRICNS